MRVPASFASSLSDQFSLLETVAVRSVVLITIVIGLSNLDIVVFGRTTSRGRQASSRREWLAEFLSTVVISAEIVSAEVIAVDVFATGWRWKLIAGLVQLAEWSTIKGVERRLSSGESWAARRGVTVVLTLSLPFHDGWTAVEVRRARTATLTFHLRRRRRVARFVIMVATFANIVIATIMASTSVSAVVSFVGMVSGTTTSHIGSIIFVTVSLALIIEAAAVPAVGHGIGA